MAKRRAPRYQPARKESSTSLESRLPAGARFEERTDRSATALAAPPEAAEAEFARLAHPDALLNAVPEIERALPAAAEKRLEEFVCPACDSPDFRVLFNATDRLYRTTERSFRVVECSHCRLIRLYPRPAAKELHRFYPENYWYAPEAGAASRLEEIYRRTVLCDHVGFVRRALQESGESGPVLDVGCGGGLFLRLLREEGTPGVGTDFSPEAASVAWRRNRVPAFCGDLENPPLAPDSCAAVTMFHVLEHLPTPDRYLNTARSLLRPNGRLIVQVPNAACWQFLLFAENWSGLDVPRHLVSFRSEDLDRLLDGCGFEVLRHKYFSLRDNPAGLATSFAPSLDPVVRKIRGVAETPRMRIFQDLVYLALVMAALPFTIVEAACRAGSTVMVEARKKS